MDLVFLAKLKLNGLDKTILVGLFNETKKWITESNQVGVPPRITAQELHKILQMDDGSSNTEVSWSVQILLDLGLIERSENKIALTQTGRLYGALLTKQIQVHD